VNDNFTKLILVLSIEIKNDTGSIPL